jgi:hypothetical protein
MFVLNAVVSEKTAETIVDLLVRGASVAGDRGAGG